MNNGVTFSLFPQWQMLSKCNSRLRQETMSPHPYWAIFVFLQTSYLPQTGPAWRCGF
jgi:hypothetical protein